MDPSSEPGVPSPTLTPREREVIALLCEGMGNRHIAARLGISPHTVHELLVRIYERLDVHDRVSAALRWRALHPPSSPSSDL